MSKKNTDIEILIGQMELVIHMFRTETEGPIRRLDEVDQKKFNDLFDAYEAIDKRRGPVPTALKTGAILQGLYTVTIETVGKLDKRTSRAREWDRLENGLRLVSAEFLTAIPALVTAA